MKTTISLSTPAQVESEALVAVVLDHAEPARNEKDKDKKPQLKVATADAAVQSLSADLLASGEVAGKPFETNLLHKPAGFDAIHGPKPAAELVQPTTRWPDDPSGVRLLQRHFHNLTPLVPLDTEASGLMVLTQDGRVWRRLTEDGDQIEQEFVVEVKGDIAPYGLHKLNHGLHYGGRALAPCKVSWQNEVRLRFAIKGVQGGQLRDMCAQVGLDVVAIRRIRIGRIALTKMPAGTWRCLPAGERF